MPIVSAFTVAREILTEHPSLDTDAVIVRARARGAKQPEPEIRRAVIKVRSWLKSKATVKPPVVAAAARHTSPTTPPTTQHAPTLAKETVERAGVFANIARVNQVVGVCGSVEAAREAAEAVRACGGVDAFLQHLELIAGIRTDKKE